MSQFNLLISTHKYKQLFYKTTTFPPFFYLSILIPLFFRHPPISLSISVPLCRDSRHGSLSRHYFLL